MKKLSVVLIALVLLSGCATFKDTRPDDTGRQPRVEPDVRFENGGINMSIYPPVTVLENGELKTEGGETNAKT